MGEKQDVRCVFCGKSLFRPRTCRKCGGVFCTAHASPRNHDCASAKPRPGGRLWKVAAVSALLLLTIVLTVVLTDGVRLPERGPPWDGSVRFVEVTEAAGVGLSKDGHGIGIDDLDGDGDLDLYVVCKNGNHFLRNNGDGTFTDLTDQTGVGQGPGGGHGVAIGDYDNDGDRDIFSANWAGGSGSPNALYRNEGDFEFTDVTSEAGLDVGDPGHSHSACIGDFNGDGWLDIVATNVGGTNFYFQNRKDGRFLYSSDLGHGDAPHGLVCTDYDVDGDLDIYLSNQEWEGNPAGNVFYENKGRGFVIRADSAGLRGETHSSFFGDFDGDGDYDFFGVDRGSQGKKAYYVNTGNRFREVSSLTGAFGPKELVHGMDCADFDLDGDLDVLLTGGHETHMLANVGGGHFEDVTERVGLGLDFGNPKAVCFFDYDGDGDQDVYVVVSGGQNRLFESTGLTSNWIKINLRGKDSNRDGIGAHIQLASGSLVQQREVSAGRGHIHDPLEQVFGLGQATQAKKLTVIWPSGLVQEITSPPVNARILVEEGSGWTEMD